MVKRSAAIPVLMILLMTSSSVFASPAGKIVGRVYDASTRSQLPGANVVIHDTELGAGTEANGVFLIRDVPAGTYSVEASMMGCRTQVKTSVVVEPGRSVELVFKLFPSAVQTAGITVRLDYFPKVADAPVSERSFSAAGIEDKPQAKSQAGFSVKPDEQFSYLTSFYYYLLYH